MREEEGLAARVLESLDITVERTRAQVVRIVSAGEEVTSGQIPFTPRAKKALELALREALSLGHDYIGTEHILLGLVREKEGVEARVLFDMGADPESIRSAVIGMLSGPTSRVLEPSGTSPGFAAWLGRALLATATEARGDGDRPVDGGDFLLSLVREHGGVAARALADLGVHEPELREAVRGARG